MREESKKFPAVMTITDVLGIEEGTVLRFDWSSGKYVSIEEVEDIAEDYYYSGFAIAIDPYVVKDNIGICFAYFEDETTTVVPTTTNKPEVTQSEYLSSDPASSPVVEKVVLNNPLVIDCSCGHRRLLKVFDSPGVNFTLMAGDSASFLELHCTECDSTMKLWFADPTDIEEVQPVKMEVKRGRPKKDSK
jgi:hypothetical protein